MKCQNCGAEIIGDQTFCISCGSKIIRANLYDVRIPFPTKNMKAITIAARIINKSKVKTAKKLSKPNALIASGISLSEAAKIKSLFKKIGMMVKIDSKIKYSFKRGSGGCPAKDADLKQSSELNKTRQPAIAADEILKQSRNSAGENRKQKDLKREKRGIKNRDRIAPELNEK